MEFNDETPDKGNVLGYIKGQDGEDPPMLCNKCGLLLDKFELETSDHEHCFPCVPKSSREGEVN